MNNPTDNKPGLVEWRQNEMQAIGAAISTRNWHALEAVYNSLRDKMDAALRTPEWVTIPARDGIEAQHGLNDVFPGDPVTVRAEALRSHERMREALEPFARMADKQDEFRREDHENFCARVVSAAGVEAELTVGDLRRARTALQETDNVAG